jgi:hypothetical protein
VPFSGTCLVFTLGVATPLQVDAVNARFFDFAFEEQRRGTILQDFGSLSVARYELDHHEDGLLFKIFANHTTLAKLLLLQVIDVLYSQLLWEEYGQTPSLDSRVFDEVRSLCISIGSFVPLLPCVCGLLTKFGEPRWHPSLNHERKENEPETVLFVTAIDPEMHRRYLTSGDAPEPAQGMCSC